MATININQSHKPSYTETIIYETDNYCLVKGWLSAWSPGATPEFLVKSKRTGKVINCIGQQSMSADGILSTIKYGENLCNKYEATT